MKTKKKRWLHAAIPAVMLAVVLAFSGIGNAAAKDLSEAQKEKEELEQQLLDAQQMITRLSDSKANIEAEVKELDEKLQGISRQISELEVQLSEKQQNVEATKEELAAAQEEQGAQYEAMKLRIQFMYENQTTSMVEQLLSAESIAELLNGAEYIAQISQYDRNMMLKYQETVETIARLEQVLESEVSELQAMKQKVEEEQLAVAALVQEKEQKLAATAGEIVDAQALAKAYEDEIRAQDEIIAQIQAEEEKDDTEEDGSNPVSAFVWPCPSSKRVTSDYGPRESPTAGASTYHKGIDIGAAHGADIVAAAGGTVTFAGYSDAAGNYVTVSHGGGLYTVYMHCSSLVVAKGDKVSAGQVIAKVGSTGVSTGNHLHFGVSLNGAYVNPWSYL